MAEVVGLYWENNAELIASDDYNLRKKAGLLRLRFIGTPGIALKLWKARSITTEKCMALSGH